MAKPFSRFLLAFAALVLAVGALMHASAFHKIVTSIANSNLEPFAANSLKILWLADSATALILAIVFGFIATRPGGATRWIIVLLSLIPAATAVLIYMFIGSFVGGHIMLAAAVAAFVGGLQSPRTHSSASTGFPIGRI
jgi:large-conductance mechanosensitive channel